MNCPARLLPGLHPPLTRVCLHLYFLQPSKGQRERGYGSLVSRPDLRIREEKSDRSLIIKLSGLRASICCSEISNCGVQQQAGSFLLSLVPACKWRDEQSPIHLHLMTKKCTFSVNTGQRETKTVSETCFLACFLFFFFFLTNREPDRVTL